MLKLPPLTVAGAAEHAHLRGRRLDRAAHLDRAVLNGRGVARLLDRERDRPLAASRAACVVAAAAGDDRESGAAGDDAKRGAHGADQATATPE